MKKNRNIFFSYTLIFALVALSQANFDNQSVTSKLDVTSYTTGISKLDQYDFKCRFWYSKGESQGKWSRL